ENLFPATSERLPGVRAETCGIDAAQRLALLCELPKPFDTEPRLDELFQTLLEQIIEVIPGACCGALLLRDRESDALLLKAYISSNGPHVNKQLVRRAMAGGKGFIQSSGEQGEENTPMTGLYVPLLWQGDALGVLCLNNPQQDANFTAEDLQIVSAVAYDEMPRWGKSTPKN
ncbi:MAG: GAF domain-containing protein, partial [bacterium]|nr:GAF domain-containing protein [bacterium]